MFTRSFPSAGSHAIANDVLWKFTAVAMYCAVLLFLGYLASKRMRTIQDYFAGGKRLGFINVAFSARATGESSWLLLGLTGTGFAFGIEGFWVVLGEMIGVGGAWLLMARRFKRLTDQYDALTVPDYLEARFRDSGHWLRLIAAGTLIIFVPIYAGSQVFATGKAFHSFLNINHFLGATIGSLIVLLYITKGGFIAVVWSDVFQGTLMLIGLVVLPIVGLMELGGITNLVNTLQNSFPSHLSITAGNGWTSLEITRIIGFAAIGIGFLGSPQVFVRFISLRSEKEITKGAGVALLWTLLADSGAVLVGVVGRGLFSLDALGGDKENILPVMSQELFPAFVAGIYIAMVLSAIMSTVDSLLIVASSAVVRDYWQKTKHPDMPDSRLVKLSQKLTLLLAFIAFGIGMGLIAYNRESQIFWIVIFGWSGIAATFCPVIILSLYWSKLTALAARCAMVAGFAATLVIKFLVPWIFRWKPTASDYLENPSIVLWKPTGATDYLGALDVLFPAFMVSFAVAIFISLLDRKGQQKLVGVAEDLRAASAPRNDASPS